MDTETAIKKLRDLLRYSYEPETEKAKKALLLGIQALLRHQERALRLSPAAWTPLPGETETKHD